MNARTVVPTTIDEVTGLIERLPSIGLDELERQAALTTRKDRKYLVSPGLLAKVLRSLPGPIQALEIDGSRWFHYESLYYDTETLDSFRLAATRRPSRFKARTRTYHHNGTTMVEVKTKDRRGRTVKHRRPYDERDAPSTTAVRDFAASFPSAAPYSARLEPVLASTYRRATIVLPETGARATIDAEFLATLVDGNHIGLPDELIVETKTSGRPSPLDRALWRAGVRPVKFSKYTTGLAALRPGLRANRWHRILKRPSFDVSRHGSRRSEPGSPPPAHPESTTTDVERAWTRGRQHGGSVDPVTGRPNA